MCGTQMTSSTSITSNSWGPMIRRSLPSRGGESGADGRCRRAGFRCATAAELEIAELLCKDSAVAEMVRLVSSGTEAT